MIGLSVARTAASSASIPVVAEFAVAPKAVVDAARQGALGRGRVNDALPPEVEKDRASVDLARGVVPRAPTAQLLAAL